MGSGSNCKQVNSAPHSLHYSVLFSSLQLAEKNVHGPLAAHCIIMHILFAYLTFKSHSEHTKYEEIIMFGSDYIHNDSNAHYTVASRLILHLLKCLHSVPAFPFG